MALIPRGRQTRTAAPLSTRDAPRRELRFSNGSGLGSAFGGGMAISGGAARLDAGKAVNENYYQNVYVYGCVRAIAYDVAARPFRVGADPANPRDFDPQHPLALRLGPAPGGPNPSTPPTQFIRWSVAQKLVTGALAWEINQSDLTLWPLLIRMLKPIPSETLRPQDGWFSKFEYGDGAKKRTLTAANVFFDFNPGQDDWRLPESALQAARLDIAVAVMQDKYDHAFLKNDARPATVVVHEQFATDEDKRAFRRGFVDGFRGPNNAGKTMFAEASPNGATPKEALLIQTLGLSQRDGAFIERYEMKIRAICIALGVPLSRLGDASGSTFNNSNVERFSYWADTVKPTGDDLADSINLKLLPLFDSSGNVGFFDYSGIPDLEPIRRFAVGEIQALYREGLLTFEESRSELHLGSVPEGTFVDVADTAAPEVAPPATESLSAEQVAAAVQAAVAPLSKALASMRDTPPPETRTIGDDVEAKFRARKEYRAHVWRKVDATASRLERSWKRAFDDLLAEQMKSTMSRLEGKRGRQALTRADDDDAAEELADAAFDKKFWEDRTRVVATTLYENTVAVSLSQLDVAFDIAFDLDAPFAQKFIRDRANQLAGQVTQTTYDGIKGALADGAAKGESIPDLAKRIEGLFSQTYANRATTVARTEVISAYNGSTALAIDNAPDDVVAGQEWISTLDDRTRDDHLEADGTIVGRGETFSVGGDDLAYPGDPDGDPSNVINCRCTIAPVTPDDMPPRERAVSRVQVERAAVALARGEIGIAQALSTLHPDPRPVLARTVTPTPAPQPAPAAAQHVVVDVVVGAAPIRRSVMRDANGNITAIIDEPTE